VVAAALLSSAWSPTRVPATQFGATDLWLAPGGRLADGSSSLADAIALLQDEKAAEAIRAIRAASPDPALAGYARLYEGRALLALEQYGEALEVGKALLGAAPAGALGEAAHWLAIEAAESAENWPEAIRQLEALAAAGARNPAQVYLRLGHAAREAGNARAAAEWYARVHHDHPLARELGDAERALAELGAPVLPTEANWSAALDRAERLFAGRRFTEAREAFADVRGFTSGAGRARVDLRIAQSEFHLRRYPTARDLLRALVSLDALGELAPEARYYYLSTLRALNRHDEYVGLVARFVEAFPSHALAETAMNELGTHYILVNEDAKAAEVFRDLYARWPAGAWADRAAWKAGWWSYKQGDYPETIRLFESAAVGHRRADYRPSWLYWSARSHEHLGHADQAAAGYRQTIADYRNSYYGREATRRLERLLHPNRPAGPADVAPASRVLPPTLDPGPAPANAILVERLLAAGLYQDAVLELQDAQRAPGSSSPRMQATIAYALNRLGQLRPSINTMRRAYPQFMAAGGEALPRDILTVIFPVAHWDLLRTHAAARKLDPFLVAALVAQESTFQADIRSPANAWGLMQIIPSTGRRYARKLGIRNFTTWRLTDPETNVRIGTTYLSELLEQFGDEAPALAAYNAGESRVARWLAERPGVDRDEFIDDIPFPETQNYVKRVLGTAEDYRLLYGNR
jgi:soluble lytic murein transglycosylase